MQEKFTALYGESGARTQNNQEETSQDSDVHEDNLMKFVTDTTNNVENAKQQEKQEKKNISGPSKKPKTAMLG
jgi:hypothetical protein